MAKTVDFEDVGVSGGGGTLSELYQNSRRLLLKTRDGLEKLERFEYTSSSVAFSSSSNAASLAVDYFDHLFDAIRKDITQVQSLCSEMDRLWRSIPAKSQRDLRKSLLGVWHHEEPVTEPVTTHFEDIVILDDDDDDDAEEPVNGNSEAANVHPLQRGSNDLASSADIDEGDGSVSLSDLSSSFQKCFHSINESQKTKPAEKSKAHEGKLQVQPFDYEEARKQVNFGEDTVGSRVDKTNKKKNSISGEPLKNEVTNEFQQGKRRQAFPASGNRSCTFR